MLLEVVSIFFHSNFLIAINSSEQTLTFLTIPDFLRTAVSYFFSYLMNVNLPALREPFFSFQVFLQLPTSFFSLFPWKICPIYITLTTISATVGVKGMQSPILIPDLSYPIQLRTWIYSIQFADCLSIDTKFKYNTHYENNPEFFSSYITTVSSYNSINFVNME